MNRAFRNWAEYLSIRSIGAVAALLPYRAALAMGWVFARLSFLMFRGRVREARRRIREVFGTQFSDTEANRIAWISWRNIFFNAIEMLRYRRTTLAWIQSVSDSRPAMETLLNHVRTGRGAVIAAPHMGAWDLASVTCRMHGVPVFNISAMQKNPLIDDYINRLRKEKDILTIMRGAGTLKAVLKNLEKGMFFVIMPDVRMRSEAIAVPFLGKIANVGAGMASFARHADVPIFPAVITRKGWTKHSISILDPVFPNKNLDKNEDLQKMTAAVLNVLERAIRLHPEQWFWFNRRWVLEPLEKDEQ